MTEFPPPNLLIRLGYSSTGELLSHLDVRDALALAGISEEREYTDRLLWWLGIIYARQSGRSRYAAAYFYPRNISGVGT